MNRRDCVHRLAASGLGLVLPAAATLLATPSQAQGALVEGRDYKRVETPVAVSGNKVEVIEFFGYWCPHCSAFEPDLEAWARKQSADKVVFRRIAVAFNAAHEPYQRLYYALESMGLVDKLQAKVFAAVHVEHKSFIKDADISAWATSVGVDGAKVVDAMKSFTVASKLRQSRSLAESFKIDGVPTLAIQGRYLTSPSIAGGHDRALAVTDQLIALSSKK